MEEWFLVMQELQPLYLQISDAVTTSVSLTNVGDIGLRIGDYFMIDDEIVRVKSSLSNPATNPLTVFRAVLGNKSNNS